MRDYVHTEYLFSRKPIIPRFVVCIIQLMYCSTANRPQRRASAKGFDAHAYHAPPLSPAPSRRLGTVLGGNDRRRSILLIIESLRQWS